MHSCKITVLCNTFQNMREILSIYSTTKKDCESRRPAARGYLSSSVFDFSCWHIFFFFGFLVGEWSIHINFSTSAAFCAFGDAWATATELRVKNATRFLLGTGVRIDHVLSVAILAQEFFVAFLCQLPWLQAEPLSLLPGSQSLPGGPFGHRCSTRKSTSTMHVFSVECERWRRRLRGP